VGVFIKKGGGGRSSRPRPVIGEGKKHPLEGVGKKKTRGKIKCTGSGEDRKGRTGAKGRSALVPTADDNQDGGGKGLVKRGEGQLSHTRRRGYLDTCRLNVSKKNRGAPKAKDYSASCSLFEVRKKKRAKNVQKRGMRNGISGVRATGRA